MNNNTAKFFVLIAFAFLSIALMGCAKKQPSATPTVEATPPYENPTAQPTTAVYPTAATPTPSSLISVELKAGQKVAIDGYVMRSLAGPFHLVAKERVFYVGLDYKGFPLVKSAGVLNSAYDVLNSSATVRVEGTYQGGKSNSIMVDRAQQIVLPAPGKASVSAAKSIFRYEFKYYCLDRIQFFQILEKNVIRVEDYASFFVAYSNENYDSTKQKNENYNATLIFIIDKKNTSEYIVLDQTLYCQFTI